MIRDARGPRILVITPVHHIRGVSEILEGTGEVTYADDPTPAYVKRVVPGHQAIFTNPNRSNVFIGPPIIDAGRDLRVICTASTGTNHIALEYARDRGVTVLSLKDEREVIGRITSTAEHAVALMLAALRRVPQAFDSVRQGEWDYVPFIGRQLDALTVGVVGHGRLGALFARYVRAFGCRVLVHDPYLAVTDPSVISVDLDMLLRESDVVSLHVHLAPETAGMVDRTWFEKMKPSAILVNTARGDVVDEADLIRFLTDHPRAVLAADVIADEVSGKLSSPLIAYARTATNAILTPHIGGMTLEAQEIAYGHAARMLHRFFEISGFSLRGGNTDRSSGAR